jgi:glycosyltransferase involved in cell wall biosynthesis
MPLTSAQPAPRISVVVRSYNRPTTLLELLHALLSQQHDSFEIVVVEQSTTNSDADIAAIAELARDARLRILHFPPLGGPGARNAGVRAARGDILVFIDDDDLPASCDWLRLHEANFSDSNCLGVTGRFVDEQGVTSIPYVNPARAEKNLLSFNILKWQRVYAKIDVRKPVESLMGGNAAIRRSTLERFGLWDECTPIEDEPSLAYRIADGKLDHEYVLFDPKPEMIRRLNAPGGMAKRGLSGPAYAQKVFTFMHNIIGHYFPVRFALLYPFYIYFLGFHCTEWIVSDSKKHTSLRSRIVAVGGLWLSLPFMWTYWLAMYWAKRLRDGEPKHAPRLLEVATQEHELMTAPSRFRY